MAPKASMPITNGALSTELYLGTINASESHEVNKQNKEVNKQASLTEADFLQVRGIINPPGLFWGIIYQSAGGMQKNYFKMLLAIYFDLL